MSNIDKKSISVYLTSHAKRRISERFGEENHGTIERVLRRAVANGLITADGNGGYLVEHGCLIIAGKQENGGFIVNTVFNLSDGISGGLKEQMRTVKPTPWRECEVEMPEDRGSDHD